MQRRQNGGLSRGLDAAAQKVSGARNSASRSGMLDRRLSWMRERKRKSEVFISKQMVPSRQADEQSGYKCSHTPLEFKGGHLFRKTQKYWVNYFIQAEEKKMYL